MCQFMLSEPKNKSIFPTVSLSVQTDEAEAAPLKAHFASDLWGYVTTESKGNEMGNNVGYKRIM